MYTALDIMDKVHLDKVIQLIVVHLLKLKVLVERDTWRILLRFNLMICPV